MAAARRFLGSGALLALSLAACSGSRFSVEGDATGGADASTPGADATTPGADSAPKEPLSVTLTIDDDEDDATWINGDDERLHYADDDLTVEVGTDDERARAGFRFALPVAARARIEAATLRLQHVAGTAGSTDTIQLQVFDGVDVAAFDGEHVHSPAAHARGGLWPTTVRGFVIGERGDFVDSPDLSVLVQHVVDDPEYAEGSTIGFIASPDQMDGWTSFEDSVSGGGAASLRITYTPP